MMYVWMALFAAGIVAVDQLTKYLTVANIDLFQRVGAWDGVFHLTYVRNTGAAFSSFEGAQWLFLLIFLVFTGAIVYDMVKKAMPFTNFERWCVAAIYGGGLANMIDRLRLGYVVDMIEVEFIRFPVFNVADCFITCGCVALLVRLIFFNRDFWKDGKK